MLLYCLFVVVLCCLMIETCKAVNVSCVVVCKDNNKVNRCGVGVVIHKVIGRLWMVLLVWMV